MVRVQPTAGTSPDQWENAHPTFGVAVTVSTAPYVAVAVTGSALPLPGGVTFVVRVHRSGVKVAVTALSPSIVSVTGVPVPATSPDHAPKPQPTFGTAARVTTVPCVYVGPAGVTVIAPPAGGSTLREST